MIVILSILIYKFEIFTVSLQMDMNFGDSSSVQHDLDKYNSGDPKSLLYRVWQLENEGGYEKSKEYAYK